MGAGSTSVERQGAHEVGGAPRGEGAPPTLVTASGTSWSRVQVSWITFGEKITFPKVSFRLDSVWTPFDILFLRNTEIGKKTAILGWASG